MRFWTTLIWVFVLCLAGAYLTRLYLKKSTPAKKFIVQQQPKKAAPIPGEKNAKPAPPAPLPLSEFTEARQLHLSDDAENKQSDFWLEQAFSAGAAKPQAGTELLHLYLSYDPKSSTRVVLRGGEIILDRLNGQNVEALAKAPLKEIPAGENVLGALWRKGELSVWLGPRQILAWKAAGEMNFSGRSGVQTVAREVKVGMRRSLALSNIDFADGFMRDTGNGVWKPLSGRWELTALAFPERSANPFSLRATFASEHPQNDPLYNDRIRETDFGLGIILSQYEGTLHVARISGGSAAARAGLQEDDIFLEIDGHSVEEYDAWQLQQLLLRGFGGDVRLKMLRPGEKAPRDFVISREPFRWGTPAEGVPIQPVKEPELIGSDHAALIAAGEMGWSDYGVEMAVKSVGYGGFGLAFGMTSPSDFMLFRWRGGPEPANAQAPQVKPGLQDGGVYDRLELVRVVAGKETLLAERKAAYRPYEFYRLGVDWNGEQVKCFIDGNEIFSANVPGLKRGQIGAYALAGSPVFFDDVRVASNRAALAASHHPERELNEIFALENEMENWANPALEWERDLKTGWAVHKSRFPGEQAIVMQNPRFSALRIQLQCHEDVNAVPCGAVLEIRGKQAVLSHLSGSSNQPPLVAKLKDEKIERLAFRSGEKGAAIDIDGVQLSITGKMNGKPGERIAVRGLKNLGDPKTVRVSSSDLLEYTFNSAPTDWKVEAGRWGLLNKWICDPRWSWFGGRTKTLAALWNKFVFSGDITVDAHVALMMQREDPPFERPGDYNMAICGDGKHLDSGYTLIFAGDNNSWTRLYRKGVLVAESNKEEARVFSDRIRHPDKPELHQRWFHVRLEKIRDEIRFYRDNVLAFSYKDPEPLPEGRVGFWTVDNGFLLSRVRIAHSGARPAPFEPRDAGMYDDIKVTNRFDGEVFTRVEPQVLPREIETALSSPRDAFKPADADPVPASARVNPAAGEIPSAWRVVNGTSGGPFALQWKTIGLDPESKGVIRFAYRIEPGAQIDLYLVDIAGAGESQTSSRRVFNPRQQSVFRWRLTGPKESSEFAPLVGDIPDVKADGRWHAVQFDLQPSWRQLWRARGFNQPRQRFFRVLVGNLDNHGYLLAGMNGNHAGAAYSISDIQALTPQETDKRAPRVARVIWPYDADGDGRSVVIVFDDAGGSGVLRESLQADINGVAVPRELADFDPVKQHLKIDLLRLNLPALSAGSTLQLRLLGFQDRGMNPSDGVYAANYTFDPTVASKAAKQVFTPWISAEVAATRDVVPTSFPLQMSEISPVTPVARLQESNDAPPWAPYGHTKSVQVVNVNDGSAFGFMLSNASYALRNWPYVQLDYKIPFETPVNLHIYDQSGQTHALLLTDTGDARDQLSREVTSRAGPPPEFTADGTWRRTTIPLQRLFDKSGSQAAYMEVRGMSLHDNGWRGNRRGMEYLIHRVQPLPAGRAETLRFAWQTSDITGVSDYASSIDDQPESDPKGKQEITSGEKLSEALARQGAPNLKHGWNYLHVAARNGAGIWSQPAHFKFFLDTAAPKVFKTEPVEGAKYAGQTVTFHLQEEHGVEVEALRLLLNGKLINAGWRGMEFDPAANTISFNAAAAGVPWPEGPVSIELRGLRDMLGNFEPSGFVLNFIHDKSIDQTGPAIEQLVYKAPVLDAHQHRQMAMESSFGVSFEEHLGHVHPMRDCRMDWLDDEKQAAFGKRAVKFTAYDDDADVQIMLHKNAWYLDRSPQLHFDYKTDAGMRVDLLVEVLGQWLSIRFTGDGTAPEGGKAIGRIDAVVADGTWRHASVDLRALVTQALPGLPYRIINKIVLSAQGRPGCKRGSTLVIDNLDLSRPNGIGGRFEWTAASDPSGIGGYAVAFTQDGATVPPTSVNLTSPSIPVGVKTGVWFVHVRACDQAGNWGRARTMRVDFGGE
ncbi:MAG TPA: PDZ domain-containing protein [Planctomycetota bacterium]|nr:PDZ domain-containing protein [Planctomycetota bacterium]